jgi:hypothetical protein
MNIMSILRDYIEEEEEKQVIRNHKNVIPNVFFS